MIYFCFSEFGVDRKINSIVLVCVWFSEDFKCLIEFKVIFSQKFKIDSYNYFGCCIVEMFDGWLMLSLGECFSQMQSVQILDNYLGKIVCVGKDGSVFVDNFFVNMFGVLFEIWSYGYCNFQGLIFDVKGQFWQYEYGLQGGDEFNLIWLKLNYGWFVIIYGENYGGGKIGEGIVVKVGMEQFIVKWVFFIVFLGLVCLRSDCYGVVWQNSFFIGLLKFGYLECVEFDVGNCFVQQEKFFFDVGCLCDVCEGLDGLFYLVLESVGCIVCVMF